MARGSRHALVPRRQLSLHSEEDSAKATKTSQCKPTYRWRKLTSKGAILIVIWNFLLASVPYHVIAYVPRGWKVNLVAWLFIMPFAGWLADVRLGRYKVIRWSIWLIWIAAMLATINSAVASALENDHKIIKIITTATGLVMAIGFGGYQANVIQFGLDQLQDASTAEITAFISWYFWTYFSSRVITEMGHKCMKHDYLPLGHLIVCVSTSIVIASTFIYHHVLIKEPVIQNPLKLVYKVIRYAIRNKYPRQRSAFTYCEDELPSRIDFGKSKYGGPFTTEQVEDVKTFLRLLVITAVASILLGQIFTLYFPYAHLYKILLSDTDSLTPFSKECYRVAFLNSIFEYTAIAVYIPIQEFILYPAFHQHFPSIKIYQKVVLGMLLQIARVITNMVFDIIARIKYIKHYNNKNITCLLFANKLNHGFLSNSFNSHLIIISQLLQSLSLILICISGIEFLLSQTPYSMRGLTVGAVYGMMFIFTMIGYGIYWPFTQHFSWATGTIISCEFWYLFLLLLVMIIFSVLLLVTGRWYKNRKREDVLPNEHIFAERYYSQAVN